LTPFGKVTVVRRTYRGDGPGKGSAVPLDDACGMRDRFMTPDVEEMAAVGAAMLTAAEVELILSKALPEGPSATAIQNSVRKRGEEIAVQREAIEKAIDDQAPLSSQGDLLAVSFDGVMTPAGCGVEDFHDDPEDPTIAIQEKGRGRSKLKAPHRHPLRRRRGTPRIRQARRTHRRPPLPCQDLVARQEPRRPAHQ
jgi:hypothetical protein